MIEKFTPEELEQIRKELKALDGKTQKDSLLKYEFDRLIKNLGVRDNDVLQKSFSAFDIKNAITLLVDHALKNYVTNTGHHSDKKRLRRASAVPDELAQNYLNCYGEIVTVLSNYSRKWKE